MKNFLLAWLCIPVVILASHRHRRRQPKTESCPELALTSSVCRNLQEASPEKEFPEMVLYRATRQGRREAMLPQMELFQERKREKLAYLPLITGLTMILAVLSEETEIPEAIVNGFARGCGVYGLRELILGLQKWRSRLREANLTVHSVSSPMLLFWAIDLAPHCFLMFFMPNWSAMGMFLLFLIVGYMSYASTMETLAGIIMCGHLENK